MMHDIDQCQKCGYAGEFNFVHGHYSCPRCKQISDGDCCQGDTSHPKGAEPVEKKDDDKWRGEDVDWRQK